MSRVKQFWFIILALSLTLIIASCGGSSGCDECIDDNGDGICDACNKEMPTEEAHDIPLFRDKTPNFHVVISKTASDEIKQAAIDSIQTMLKNTHDVDVTVLTEDSEEDKKSDVEILIGEISSRGDKYFSKSLSLGKKGFEIRIVGSKIIINAGSNAALVDAINIFAENILTVTDITNLVMKPEDETVFLPEYLVTAIKVDGNDVKDYTIAANLTLEHHKNAALALQDAIYQEIGYWLPVDRKSVV